VPIIAPEQIINYGYDKIIVASLTSYETIANKLLQLGVPAEKIDTSYVAGTTIGRDKFLSSFAAIVYANEIAGSVAECGVCEGNFARKINAAFPDRTIYLFDTFEGFDKRDVDAEQNVKSLGFGAGHLNLELATEEHVMSILPHPEKAVVRKGYFPETADGIGDSFVFVNLDFDLYKPTITGLEFFYPQMTHGGVILVHDFFNDSYQGIKSACDEFCKTAGTAYIPIGDEMSIAITKSG
jgi:hypothetical protein